MERTGIEPTWSFPGTHAQRFIAVIPSLYKDREEVLDGREAR
jgi:hypothetical protein